MSRTTLRILLWGLLLELSIYEIGLAEPVPLRKLISYKDIIGEFEQGKDKVKVIVNLAEPQQTKAAINWKSVHSLQALQREVEATQGSVLSTLSADQFKLRHRFENQAGFSGEVTLEGLARLVNDPRVESIEPVFLLTETLKQGISLINASAYRTTYNGQGVAIAICDSGIDYTHPKLGGGAFPNSKVIGGRDFGDNDADPFPDADLLTGHGTACAGIAAGDLGTIDDYVGGVAPGAKLYALKVKNKLGVYESDAMLAALDWCISHQNDDPCHPILVVSSSLGSGRYIRPCDCLEDTEGFERGDFLNLPWMHAGDKNWTITSDEKYSGTYSAKAGNISNDELSILALMVDCKQGSIKFWLKVSSELLHDYFDFYVDDVFFPAGSWCGSRDWEQFSLTVTEGEHIFIWVYSKDASVSVGEDTVWIDDITFPARCPSAFAEAVNGAVAAGITVLAGSGNDGYCDSICYPACLSNAISVGTVYDAALGTRQTCVADGSCAAKYLSSYCSTGWYAADETAADAVQSNSNTASFLHILAPGTEACTTDIAGSKGYSAGDYIEDFGGTSAACAYAAGAAACLQSAAKEIIGSYFSPSDVKDILVSTGDNITDPKAHITTPRVNLARAIESLHEAEEDDGECAAIAIGTGTSTWSHPMRTDYHDSRTQVIYLAGEIGMRGTITALALDVTTPPGQTLNNWTIRMKHTTLSEYATCELDATGWTVVYQKDEPVGGTGWRTFKFSTPFEYNGVDNLLVDFSHNDSSYTSSGTCRYSSPAGARSAYAYSNSLFADPLNWSGSASPSVYCSNYVPNVQLTICRQYTLVFEDSFQSTTIDPNKWTVVDGVTVDDVGMGEPSPDYSLRLNAHPSGGDSIESKVIDLSPYSQATLTYYYQQTGGGNSPEAEDDLVIDYNDGLQWVELARHAGDGPDMTIYENNTIDLPADALHAGFGLRIRSIGSRSNVYVFDDWFVDDLKIQSVKSDCFPSTYSTYSDWVALGRPICWCAKPKGSGYQCDGDAENVAQEAAAHQVYINDLVCVIESWKKTVTDAGFNACCDFDHRAETVAGHRVYINDLNILITNWKKTSAELPGNCPRPE